MTQSMGTVIECSQLILSLPLVVMSESTGTSKVEVIDQTLGTIGTRSVIRRIPAGSPLMFIIQIRVSRRLLCPDLPFQNV
jgi:hypothetical protein